MNTLDCLISKEEKKIDYLMDIRNGTSASGTIAGSKYGISRAEDIDLDIKQAWEQLTIYKIRKEMGF